MEAGELRDDLQVGDRRIEFVTAAGADLHLGRVDGGKDAIRRVVEPAAGRFGRALRRRATGENTFRGVSEALELLRVGALVICIFGERRAEALALRPAPRRGEQ